MTLTLTQIKNNFHEVGSQLSFSCAIIGIVRLASNPTTALNHELTRRQSHQSNQFNWDHCRSNSIKKTYLSLPSRHPHGLALPWGRLRGVLDSYQLKPLECFPIPFSRGPSGNDFANYHEKEDIPIYFENGETHLNNNSFQR